MPRFVYVTAALVLSAGSLRAEPTVELMVQEAAGLLHHSCNSLVEVTGGDEDAIVEVVKKMVAVSLINRQIDLSEYAGDEEKNAELREAFVEELSEGCKEDRDAPVIAIVDAAVKSVLGL